ncbi:hypothetical protein JCM3770_004987 [Rhodotorula araucariae]
MSARCTPLVATENALQSSSGAVGLYSFAVSPEKKDANGEAAQPDSATKLRVANRRPESLSAGGDGFSMIYRSGDEGDEHHRPHFDRVEMDIVPLKRTAREERDAREAKWDEEIKQLMGQVEALQAHVARLNVEKASIKDLEAAVGEHDTLRLCVLGPVQSAEWAVRTSRAVLVRRLEETKAGGRDAKRSPPCNVEYNRLIRALVSTSILKEPAPVTSIPSLQPRAPPSSDEVRNLVKFFENWNAEVPHRAGMFLEAAQVHLDNRAQRNSQARPTCKLIEWEVLMQGWCRRFKLTKVEIEAEFCYIAPAVISHSGGFDGPAFSLGVASRLPIPPPTRIAASDASGSVAYGVPPISSAQGQARATGESSCEVLMSRIAPVEARDVVDETS